MNFGRMKGTFLIGSSLTMGYGKGLSKIFCENKSNIFEFIYNSECCF
jgi:hypothetical protein